MALSKVDIGNLALARVGSSRLVNDFEERTTEAKLLKLHYDHLLDCALAEVDWSFARAEALLTAASVDPPDRWGYAYLMPEDCIRAIRIDDGLQVRRASQRIQFALNVVDGVRLLYTDRDEATLIYTKRVTVPALWPATFADYLAWALAAEIAMPLTNDRLVRQEAIGGRQFALTHAVAVNFNEEQESQEPDGDFLASRS